MVEWLNACLPIGRVFPSRRVHALRKKPFNHSAISIYFAFQLKLVIFEKNYFMLTIQTSSGEIDVEEILRGLAQLPVHVLEDIVKKLQAILEQRRLEEFSEKEKAE